MEIAEETLVLETRALTKRFGAREAVSGLDLSVPAACAFGLLGPNGAGKTTLIRLVLGMTRPSAGEIRLMGLPMPAERRAALAKVGAIVEEPRFHFHLSGRENLRVAAAVRDRTAFGRIEELLERVGLTDRADERVGAYSLGMRQRLGIARCLLSDPRLLILDEPMNGLDPAGILEIRGLIRSLVGEGRTVVVSSHLLDEIEKTCDFVAIVDKGRLVVSGPLREVAGAGRDVLVGCDDPALAVVVLRRHHAVARAVIDGHGVLRITPAATVPVPTINRWLVEAGVQVGRLEPVRSTLEERFLEITASMETAR